MYVYAAINDVVPSEHRPYLVMHVEWLDLRSKQIRSYIEV